MPDVIVIGDGPGGLFGEDQTAMNYALLRNYLGLPEIVGAEFQVIARKQATDMGARLCTEHVDDVAAGTQRFSVAKSNLDGVYVVGRSARPGRSQAIISAGDGAAAAIDILSRERNADVVDWDEPPKA